MYKLTLKTSTVLVAMIALLGLSACQQETAKPLTAAEKIVAPDEDTRKLLETASEVSTQSVVQTSDADADANYDEDNGSMSTVIFNGKSEAAFQASMEEFQSIANSSQINALTSAINYLKFYDLAARGNIEKIHQSVDGLSAEQIILRAKGVRKN